MTLITWTLAGVIYAGAVLLVARCCAINRRHDTDRSHS
jgi:hypothetical protein